MENDDILRDSLIRKSQETQLALADAIVAVSKATVTAILTMENIVADEDNSPELRVATAKDIISRIMPERSPIEGTGSPAIDINAFKEKFLSEIEDAL